ncbi:MAG: TIR domain-containing protein [Firmicutes bacterium]|nr:TIR domain-containing protein [Bacillota bacterium]
METYQYKAFISYRHTPPDEEIAKKLHTAIETYSVPKDIREKLGISRMGRVFRDQEELPLSQDLGGDIRVALEHSEWLIVICSPRYLESKWCNAELDYFIELGKRDHILAVLAEGEPDEAFPPQLRFIEVDGRQVELEPLAADVRAATTAESLKKLKNEKLRILAPMLGVNYDHLRQRARRRRNRVIAGTAAACFALLSGFLAYAVVKNVQITKQRNLALDNQMQLLVEQANLSSSSGSKLLATSQLLEAADVRQFVGDKNDTAFRAALEYALYNEEFEPVLTIDNDNRQFDSLVFSHNDKYLLGITNLNSACLIDATTGKILSTVSRSDLGQLDSVGFTADDRYFYMVDSWYGFVSLYDVQTGELAAQYDASDGTAWNIAEKVFPLSDGRLMIVKRDVLVLWDYEKNSEEEILAWGDGTVESYTQGLIAELSPDEKRVAIGSHGWGSGMRIVTLDGKEEVPLEHEPQRGYYELRFSGDGSRLAAVSGTQCAAWDAKMGRLLLTPEREDDWPEHVVLNEDGSILLVMTSSYLGALEVDSGAVLWEKEADSNVVTEAYLSPNGRYVCASGGISGIFDLQTGDMLCEEGGTVFSSDSSKVLVGTYGSSPVVLTTPEASTATLEKSFSEELFEIPRFTEPEGMITVTLQHFVGDYYTTPPGNANRQSQAFTSPDLKYAAQTHYDGFIETFDISDPDNVKNLASLAEHCYNSVTDVTFYGSLMASCGGFDPRCVLFDLESGQILHVLMGEGYCWGCEFSPDGSKIILLSGRGRQTAFVYSVESGNLLYRFDAKEGSPFDTVGFTPDGRKAAAVMEDGSAWVGTLYPTIEELVEEARER